MQVSKETPQMSIGIDIVENKRVVKLFRSYGQQFLEKFLTTRETRRWQTSGQRPISLCGIFAAKEAVIKAVGIKKINFSHVQVAHNKNGVPLAAIIGKKTKLSISISHEKSYTVAVAICD